MLASAFSGSFVISVVILIFLAVALGFTSLRRLHDAKLNRNWLIAPSFTFTLVAVVIIFSEQYSSYYLLVIPILCSAVLLTYPSVTKHKFILGYFGPVDLTEYQQELHPNKQTKFRIEPTLIGGNAVNLDNNTQHSVNASDVGESYYSQSVDSSTRQTDIGELIRLKLLKNKKAQLLVIAIIVITLIGVIASWFVNYLSSNDKALTEVDLNKQIETKINRPTRNHPLEMPDNYTLYLSEHQGISINWQADEVTDSVLWSQLTAQGDESCKEISFNKGEPIRTLSVQVLKNGGSNVDYFADFSPLDSKSLIQALAFRGSFTLCGYDFSLKGSQAALGKNSQYAQWVDY